MLKGRSTLPEERKPTLKLIQNYWSYKEWNSIMVYMLRALMEKVDYMQVQMGKERSENSRMLRNSLRKC